jgi:hypothetical protein
MVREDWGSTRSRLCAPLQVEQLPALHAEVDRAPEEREQQAEEDAVEACPNAADEARAVDGYQGERPCGRTRGISLCL